MTELTELVTQRKLEGEAACPRCGCDFKTYGTGTTLLGCFGPVDLNHTWDYCTCNACQFQFMVERKSGNTWITKDKKVLAGLPNCFEDYIYTCVHCNGNVVRKHTAMNGETVVGSLLTTREGKQYRTFYLCASCNIQIEVPS